MRRSARSIGAELRAARLKGGLTQADLAARSGVSRQWVISVESGSSRAEIGLVMRAAE
ncbi:MAG: helix-turn-helix domain-containing protein, partial [Nocardioidaceae bacterium]